MRPTIFSTSAWLFIVGSTSLKSCCWKADALTIDSFKRHSLFPRTRRSSSVQRHMVLTTPESIIEQASTQNLLDVLIDESVRTSARGPIMMQFNPSSGWIWKRWRGTIFNETWDSCVKSMLYAVAVLMVFKQYPALKVHFSGFNVLWGQLLSVTTFTLTFFVNQSYALWRKCLGLSRRLQGRLHDIGMSLAIHATRKAPSSPNEPSTYTAASRQTLELVSRYVRLFNILTYASFTRSHRPILTPRGMRRLVERGLMTSQERQVLVDAEIPATQRHNAVLLWITRVFVEGWQAGHFIGATGFENQILEKIHVTRSCYGAIGDELAGRMPLAYAHIVQVLVDCVLWFYPFMAIVSGMSDGLVVLGTGLLTISYQGLFDLAKQFLDPYDNESYGKGEDPLVVDTLIAETNAGSVRWMNSLNEFPVSPQRIKDGELQEYLLPVRGYSVEDLAEMEEDRKKRERELQERREREEEERRAMEEKTERLREASEAMIPALLSSTPELIISPSTKVEIINGDVSSPDLFDNVATPFTLSSAQAVSNVVSNLNAIAGGIPSSLLPRGAAASKEEDEMVVQRRKLNKRNEVREPSVSRMKEIEDDDEINDDDEIYGLSEDFYDDGAFEVLEDWGTEQNYIHQFESFDNYKDLPWFDEVGPDGQEIRLSQMLAEEEWEEEREAAREKEKVIKTFEEYSSRVEEIRQATNSELAETKEILSAVPNAEYSPENTQESKRDNLYDQTKLDGISQLWGCAPGELSDLPSYSEPAITGGSDFRGIAQLFGEPEAPLSSEKADYDQFVSDKSASFSSIGALWGESFGNDFNREAAPPEREVPKNYRDLQRDTQNQRDESSGPRENFVPSEGSGVRLSQILADETWDEALEKEDELEKSVSFEEYTQQIADILEAEKEEMLETEAILNAPSFAEFVGTSDDEENSGSVEVTNSTIDEEDLSVFEMDVTEAEEQPDSMRLSSSYNETGSEPGVMTVNETDIASARDDGTKTESNLASNGEFTKEDVKSKDEGSKDGADLHTNGESPTNGENPPTT